jgi:hypothetical protein
MVDGCVPGKWQQRVMRSTASGVVECLDHCLRQRSGIADGNQSAQPAIL